MITCLPGAWKVLCAADNLWHALRLPESVLCRWHDRRLLAEEYAAFAEESLALAEESWPPSDSEWSAW